MPESKDEKGVPALVAELWDLVREYARQETIAPVQNLGRYAFFGLAGSASLAVGLVVLTLALLRLLQAETGTALTGNLSWIPYLATLVAASGVAVAALKAIRQ